MGQYNHRPLYAHWGLQKQAVLRMILELVEARLGEHSAIKVLPVLDMRPSKEKGTTFSLRDMPISPFN